MDENAELEIIVEYEGTDYTVIEIHMDVSEEVGKPEGTCFMEHRIEGFDEDIYTVIDFEDKTCSFVLLLKDAGLVVSVQDEEVNRKAFDIMVAVEQLQDELGYFEDGI